MELSNEKHRQGIAPFNPFVRDVFFKDEVDIIDCIRSNFADIVVLKLQKLFESLMSFLNAK